MTNEHTFTAEIQIAGINPYVDVPEEVMAALETESRAAVLARVVASDALKGAVGPPSGRLLDRDAGRLRVIGRLSADGWFRTTLVPSRKTPVRLYLDTWMREAAGVKVGDHAQVTLRPDPNPRDLPLPELLVEALLASPSAKVAWEELTPSRRREILTYLNFLKTPAALERNVRKVLASLLQDGSSEGKEPGRQP